MSEAAKVRSRSPQIPSPPEARPPSAPHVNGLLWVLLAASAVFLISVQFWLRSRDAAPAVSAERLAELPTLGAESPQIPVPANGLVLDWDAVPGAREFHLRIHHADGTPVVDPVVVWTHTWSPSTQVLPGLTAGAYQWTVEALDASGVMLARSLPQSFRIG